ncbi:QRFP-like peptide receptor [Actinia tenebrosa]|uniref:QRFP-like peptide receptor n=1 Tax=Actinia tenebrosa TaxID=6105 RepID=A0A6P8J237_ACTTE|nr:QRFP-like peptide receptor [Actinia tenebrosa]
MFQLFTNNKPAQVGVAVSLSILIAANVIGNILVILIILTNKSMKSPMNYLLVNLAVADMMVGIFIAPKYVFISFFTHSEGVAGKILCTVLTGGLFAWVGAVASSFTLVSVACERYFAIVHPYSIQLKLNMKRLKLIVIFCWPYALLLTFPSFFTLEFSKDLQLCMEQWSMQPLWVATTYSTLWLIFVGVIPISIMFVLYSRVIYSLWFKQNQVQGTNLAVLKSRKRVTKMMVIVSVVYAASWLPILLVYHNSQFDNDTTLAAKIPFVASVVLSACNSAINPFVYTLQSERFRRLLMRLLRCRKQRQNCIAVVKQGKY